MAKSIENGVNGVNGNIKTSEFKFSTSPTLEELRAKQAEFCKERNWDMYHTPRNLLLALVGEVGELAELFQWKGEVDAGLPNWTDEDRTKLSHELSDVFIYLIRLSQQCHVDLPNEVLKKIQLNSLKYPKDKCFGSSKKYDEYE